MSFDSAETGPHGESTSMAEEGATDGLREYRLLVQRLAASLGDLERTATLLQLPPLAGREWFDLLHRKLMPQLVEGSPLIVAVVGGTNIGKSVIFNHIAGFRASASSPMASGTKHPVCLVPSRFGEEHDLKEMFPSFELRAWTGGDEALREIPEHILFWRAHDRVPRNLLILDTPDVDSDAPINWQRADAVRQAADVLVAVLTQQKYNDAAVKQFFRKAAEEDKAAIIIFNQLELPDDEPYWPQWLKTFCDGTGLKPELVYLAPHDRKAAEAIALRFEERPWGEGGGRRAEGGGPRGEDGKQRGDTELPPSPLSPPPSSLSSVLSQLRFAEIKLRTLRGSLVCVAERERGGFEYLEEVRAKSLLFREAGSVFASRSVIQQANWPAPPNGLLVDEMWSWWDRHREAWTAGVHGFYSRITRTVLGGIKSIRQRMGHVEQNPLDLYRQLEWDAVVRVLERLYEQLHIIARLDNQLLADRLNRLLSGTSCEVLLAKLKDEHARFDFAQLIQELVAFEMDWLKTERQQLFNLLRNADGVAAVFRPLLTAAFAFGGGIGAEHMLVQAATQAATHVAVDATAVAATTVVGETAVTAATGVVGQAKAALLRLHEKFKARREAWLLDRLRHFLLGDLLDELQTGANVVQSSEFVAVESALLELAARLMKPLESETSRAWEQTATPNPS